MSQIFVENANTWRLSGELNFANVGALLTEFSQLPPLEKGGILDLSEITRTDSAGLALLIELLKQTASITFRNIPAQMQNLAAVTGVQDILTKSSAG